MISSGFFYLFETVRYPAPRTKREFGMNSKANPVTWFEIPVRDLHGGNIVMPKAGGGEHGSIGQFEDPEGNIVALYSDET
jgi:predicted enzyme related to lactoylglutathione lyase